MNKRQVAALIAEFVGTFTLVLVVLNVSRYGLPLFTALAAGVTIATFVSIFSKISGGHFNPAVTVGLFSLRQVSFVRTICYVAVQFFAAAIALQAYRLLNATPVLNNATDPEAISNPTWTIFWAEFLGAIVFGLVIAAVVKQKIEGYQAAVAIGMGLFLGITVAGLASKGILNPAVAVGMKSADWYYILGPILGVLTGMNVYAYFMSDSAGKAKVAPVVSASKASTAKTATTKKSPAKKKAPAKKKK